MKYSLTLAALLMTSAVILLGQDELDVAGCVDPSACNWNEGATEDDGSCLFMDEILENCCSLETINNTIYYNPAEDPSPGWFGMSDAGFTSAMEVIISFDGVNFAGVSGSTWAEEALSDGDSSQQQILTLYPALSTYIDLESAMNIHLEELATLAIHIETPCGTESLNVQIPVHYEFYGCSDPGACNPYSGSNPYGYDVYHPYDSFQGQDNVSLSEDCDYDSCPGCSDETALNYAPGTIDDGSCIYLWDSCDSIGGCMWDSGPYARLVNNFNALGYGTISSEWATHGGQALGPRFACDEAIYTRAPFAFSNVYGPVLLPEDSALVAPYQSSNAFFCIPKFVGEPHSRVPHRISELAITSIANLPPGVEITYPGDYVSGGEQMCLSFTNTQGVEGTYDIEFLSSLRIHDFNEIREIVNYSVPYRLVLGGNSSESACSDESACNYGNSEGGPCLYLDECGQCGGGGILEGACDCEGNALDAVGECGGSCVADEDGDGICDGPPSTNSCGLGTVWDPIAQQCLVAFPADINVDGCVGSPDLLELLASFGICESQ